MHKVISNIERGESIRVKDSVKTNSHFLTSFRKSTFILTIIAALLQCVFFPTLENLFAVASIFISWYLFSIFILEYYVVSNFPLSSFLVLGYTMTQSWLPLIFTLLDGHPVTYNLNVPYQVFFHSFLGVLVVLLAHYFYRTKIGTGGRIRQLILRGLKKLNIFNPPSDKQIWLMGLLGLLAMFYVYFLAPSVGNEITGAANDKFIQGIVPFVYAPYYMLLSRLYNSNKTNKVSLISLLIFTIFLFVASLGKNSRGAFMLGFTGVGFGYFLGLLLGFFPPNLLTKKNIFIAAVGFWLITGPLSDLGIAMVIVREKRGAVSQSELVYQTLEQFKDKEALHSYKKLYDSKLFTGWDEEYLNNIFLARFCNLKYNDASLEMAGKIGGVDPEMTQYAIERPLAAFPQPVISLLGLQVDKTKVNSFSAGDFLFDKTGGINALGGFRVGHFAGFGMVSFGWWYLALLFLLIMPAFYFWDTLALQLKSLKTGERHLTFSLCGLIALTAVFQFLSIENVIYITIFPTRVWIQMIFLYWVIFLLTRFASTLFKK